MTRVDFPHILTYPKQAYNFPKADIVRVVAPTLSVGDELRLTIAHGKDLKLETFKVSEIIAERKVRGDWSNWGVHPNYYECKMEIVPKI